MQPILRSFATANPVVLFEGCSWRAVHSGTADVAETRAPKWRFSLNLFTSGLGVNRSSALICTPLCPSQAASEALSHRCDRVLLSHRPEVREACEAVRRHQPCGSPPT